MSTPATAEECRSLALLAWHIERYDRLRVSTAMRASVVLSATAILFAGNALVVSRLLEINRELKPAVWGALTSVLIVSLVLVVISLVHAAEVLVTARGSRAMFRAATPIPSSFVFNGTDTVRMADSFEAFRSQMAGQTQQAIIESAQVELWFGILQHRQRYGRLRKAVTYLRLATISFFVLTVGMLLYGRFVVF